MKAYILVILVNLIIAATPLPVFPTMFPTGTTVYNPAKSYNGYVLFTPLGVNPENPVSTVYLINMNGTVVHRWHVPMFAIQARLSPDGNLLFIGQNPQENWQEITGGLDPELTMLVQSHVDWVEDYQGLLAQ